MNIYNRIKDEIDLENTEWMANTEIKEILQKAYDNARIVKKATATDIQLFYDSVPHQKRIDGVQVNGYKFYKYIQE